MSVESLSVLISDQSEHPYSNTINLSLRQKPSSPDAIAFVRGIASKVSGKSKPLSNHVKIIGAIIGDLLRGLAMTPPHTCYRKMRTESFSGHVIGHTAFKSVRDTLRKHRYIKLTRGQWGSAEVLGVATRVHPTEQLLEELAAAGIRPENYHEHFTTDLTIPLVPDPVRCRAGSVWRSRKKIIGKPMKVKQGHPQVIQLSTEVAAINSFLEGQTFDGFIFEGLYRGFNMGNANDFQWDKGGRLYAIGGAYQSKSKSERQGIRINGEPTCEVDIGASHLTILHGKEKVRLPGEGDPYDTGAISRDAVKRFVTMAMGKGSIPTRWSSESVEEYLEDFHDHSVPGMTGDLEVDYPFELVRGITLQHIPLLRSIKELPYSWADFQYLESKILIASIIKLMKEDIVTLPLHDSLICRIRDRERVSRVIKDMFKSELGCECITKYK